MFNIWGWGLLNCLPPPPSKRWEGIIYANVSDSFFPYLQTLMNAIQAHVKIMESVLMASICTHVYVYQDGQAQIVKLVSALTFISQSPLDCIDFIY